MSQDQIDALVARYNADAEFAAAMDAATADDAARIAADYGFDVSAAELAAASDKLVLTDAELEGVTGGYSCSPNCAPRSS